MSIESNYAAADWQSINLLPTLIGTAAACAGTSGLFGTMKESLASVQAMMEGVKSYPDNALISAIAPNPADRAAAKERALGQRAAFKEKMASHEVKRREELIVLALDEARRVAHVLPSGATEQAVGEFKEWVQGISVHVSNAAKEGGFLGIGGTRVSEGEQQFIEDLRMALGSS